MVIDYDRISQNPPQKTMAALTLALAAAAVGALPNMNGVLPNMNGVYYIQDGNSTDSGSHTIIG